MKYQKKKDFLIFEKKYQVLNGREVAERIIKMFDDGQPLSDKQKSFLKECLDNEGYYGNRNLPFQAYEWQDKSKERGVLQIISTPIVMLLNLLCVLTICPIKFIFTGNYKVDCKNKWLRWLYLWAIYALGEE